MGGERGGEGFEGPMRTRERPCSTVPQRSAPRPRARARRRPRAPRTWYGPGTGHCCRALGRCSSANPPPAEARTRPAAALGRPWARARGSPAALTTHGAAAGAVPGHGTRSLPPGAAGTPGGRARRARPDALLPGAHRAPAGGARRIMPDVRRADLSPTEYSGARGGGGDPSPQRAGFKARPATTGSVDGFAMSWRGWRSG
jgi:hypothetical protein